MDTQPKMNVHPDWVKGLCALFVITFLFGLLVALPTNFCVNRSMYECDYIASSIISIDQPDTYNVSTVIFKSKYEEPVILHSREEFNMSSFVFYSQIECHYQCGENTQSYYYGGNSHIFFNHLDYTIDKDIETECMFCEDYCGEKKYYEYEYLEESFIQVLFSNNFSWYDLFRKLVELSVSLFNMQWNIIKCVFYIIFHCLLVIAFPFIVIILKYKVLLVIVFPFVVIFG